MTTLQSLYAVKDRKTWPAVSLLYWKDSHLNSNILVAVDNQAITLFSPLDMIVFIAADLEDILLKDFLEKSVMSLTRPDYYAGGYYRPLAVYRPPRHDHMPLSITRSLPSSAPRTLVNKINSGAPRGRPYTSRISFVRADNAASADAQSFPLSTEPSLSNPLPVEKKKKKKSEEKKDKKTKVTSRSPVVKMAVSTPTVPA